MTKIFNPDEVTLTVGGKLIGGFADGGFLEIAEPSPRVTKVVGTDGEVVISRHMDRSGEGTLTLLQTSDSNDVFQDMADAMATGDLVGAIKPFYAADRNGRAKHEATHCWVAEAPSSGYDRGAQPRAWKLGFGTLKNAIRGSKLLG